MKFSSTLRDDANDTLVFQELEKNALNSFPNPQRIGCPDDETLKRFVETPNEVTVDELSGWHIYECRECTLQLQELRQLREELLRRTEPRSYRGMRLGWKPVFAVASLCVFVIIGSLSWRSHTKSVTQSVFDATVVPVRIDLSLEGTPRGHESEGTPSASSLPRRLVNLDIILPYFSQPGEYRVAVTKGRDSDSIQVEQPAAAEAQSSRTELRVTIDLRQVARGTYYLSTIRSADGTVNFYPLNIY